MFASHLVLLLRFPRTTEIFDTLYRDCQCIFALKFTPHCFPTRTVFPPRMIESLVAVFVFFLFLIPFSLAVYQ